MPHTPGPWVGFVDDGQLIAIMPAGRDGDICVFKLPPSEADGRLMTAAPDLLEAAQLLEAAELARGPDCPECFGEGEPEACGICFPKFDDARIKRRVAIAKATTA